MKLVYAGADALAAWGRSPCGERGLKSTEEMTDPDSESVAPRAGSVD